MWFSAMRNTFVITMACQKTNRTATKRWDICIVADWSSGFRSRRLPRTERRKEEVLNDVTISTSWKRLRSIERERETARFLLTDKWRKAFATNYGTDTSSCGPSRPIFTFHRSDGLSGSSCYYCRPLYLPVILCSIASYFHGILNKNKNHIHMHHIPLNESRKLIYFFLLIYLFFLKWRSRDMCKKLKESHNNCV